MISKLTSVTLLGMFAALIIGVLVLIEPIPQPQSYHNFADQREWLGIPNAWNVLSNSAFALAGIWGLYLLLPRGKVQFFDERERWIWMGVSIGLILTALGSGYYHLDPDNFRLVWDRLPLIFAFMSVIAALIYDRINSDFGLYLWPALVGIGFFAVWHWHASELQGSGDLRFYIGMQIFTLFAVLVLMLTPSHYTRSWDLAFVPLFYGFARLFEIFDHQIYSLTQGLISGHTLKHFAAALAGFWLIQMIWKRKIKVKK